MIPLGAGVASALLAVIAMSTVRRRSLVAATVWRTRAVSAGSRSAPRVRPLERFAAAIGRRRRSRVDPANAAALAALLDQAARHCASGESLSNAFASAVDAGPLAATFERTLAAMRAGSTLSTALGAQPVRGPDVALVVHVLRLCALEGGNVSESLDRAAATLRERDAVAQERAAHSAQARLSARVLTVLPVAFAAWTLATTASVRRFYGTPVGLACLAAGLTLNVVGWRWMQRVSRGLR
jgi:tight adherence protein B